MMKKSVANMKWLDFRKSGLLLVIIGFALAAWAMTELPDQVALHWNSSGEADGYSSKFWGAWLLPLISALIYGLSLAIPKLEVRHQNLAKFRRYYDRFFASLLTFFLFLYAMTLWWNIVGEFNFNRMISIGFAFLTWEIAVLVGNAKSNWFVGIRTPWTLTNDRVWDDTHRLAKKMYQISAGMALIGVAWPSFAFIFVLVPITVASLIAVIYSFVRFKELK